MTLTLPSVSIVTVNYNHAAYLEAYIKSLQRSQYPIFEVIIVDNHSTDDSLEILQKEPNLQIIQNPQNLGYSAALNQAFQHASSPLVCATGPDVVVESDWLNPLVNLYLQRPETTFAVVSCVLTYDRSCIQSAGSSLHFTGHLNVFDMWKPESRDQHGPKEIGAVDSTSVLFDRLKFLEIGGCDPDFFVYHEEFDYCYRARMRGWRCWYHPASVVYHGSGTAQFSVRGEKEYPRLRPYLHNRNRLLSIVKNYQLRTILGIFPAMIVVELLNFLLLLRLGLQREYIEALRWVWRNHPRIAEKRYTIQTERRINDGLLLTANALTIAPVLTRNPFLSLMKSLLDMSLAIYWKLLKVVLYR